MSQLNWWEKDKGLQFVYQTSQINDPDAYENWEPYINDLETESLRALNQHFQIQLLNGYPDTICTEFMKTLYVKSPKEYRSSFLLYHDGIWVEEPEIVIENKLYDYLRRCYYWKGVNGEANQVWLIDSRTITSLAKAVLRILRAQTLCSIRDFNRRKGAIPVLNGILNYSDLKNIHIEPHTPFNYFTYKINAKYAPEAICPIFDNFVGQMLSSPTKKKEQRDMDKRILLKHVGEFLLANPSIYSKTPILIGKTRSGKTTFLEALRIFVGFDYTMNRSLQEFQEDQYAIADLEHKLYNFYSDLPFDRTLFEVDKIKILTDPYLSGNKKWEHRRTFPNTCKHFYGGNQLFPLKNQSKAFGKRFNIIECGVNYEEKDRNLLEKLTTPQERSGLLNHAISGLILLMGDGEHEEQDIEEIWDRKSETLQYFLEHTYNEVSSNASNCYIPLTEILDQFNQFLTQQDMDTWSINYLGKKINELGYEKRRYRIGDSKKTCLVGWEDPTADNDFTY